MTGALHSFHSFHGLQKKKILHNFAFTSRNQEYRVNYKLEDKPPSKLIHNIERMTIKCTSTRLQVNIDSHKLIYNKRKRRRRVAWCLRMIMCFRGEQAVCADVNGH